jgi:2-polyprenyl-6-methoxyphenol hydroxylase-like FAD-dependent oxidoreductase
VPDPAAITRDDQIGSAVPRPHALISGASIAGPCLAYWLHRYGWDTTVVERAGALRLEGQNIDVRGAGREVARRTGIEADIRAAGTGEVGTQFIGAGGRPYASFPAGTSDTDGATAELEILRGSLSQLLWDRTRDDTEYLFGDHITGIDDGADRVTVSFDHGPDRGFDLVVLAEGLRSRTRALVFGDEPAIRYLGQYTAYLAIPRTEADSDWWRWHNAPGGRIVTLRPDNVGTTRATLSFLSGPRGYEDLRPGEQKELLRRVFAGAGWEAPRILAALDDATLYFEAVAQVRAPRWSRGRVALVGDAACGPSPVSGMGTSLALVGSYVLAGEIAAHAHLRDALTAYEAIVRPYAAKAQKLPPGAPRAASPRSRAGLAVLRAGLKIAASRPAALAGGIGGRIFSPPAGQIDLPTYTPVRCAGP